MCYGALPCVNASALFLAQCLHLIGCVLWLEAALSRRPTRPNSATLDPFVAAFAEFKDKSNPELNKMRAIAQARLQDHGGRKHR